MAPDGFDWLIEPAVRPRPPGAPMVLFQEVAELSRADGTRTPGYLTVRASLDGRPAVAEFEGTGTSSEADAIGVSLRDVSGPLQVGQLLTDSQQPTLFEDRTLASFVPKGARPVLVHDGQNLATTVVAHLLNVPAYRGTRLSVRWRKRGFAGPGRLAFEADGWRVVIEDLKSWALLDSWDREDDDAAAAPVTEDLPGVLGQQNRTGSTVITHVVSLSRTNDAAFGVERALTALDRLEALLSFAFGARTRPLYPHGFSRFGQLVWRALDVTPPLPGAGAGRGAPGWLPQLTDADRRAQAAAEPTDLAPVLTGINRLAQTSDADRQVFNRAIDWYLGSLRSAGRPESVVLAQAGLELLAWRRLTGDLRMSEKGRRAIDASDQLRVLLATSGIPLEVPDTLASLKARKIGGPEAVTLARNRAVHPEPLSERGRSLTGEQASEAQLLAIRYLELLLLRLVGYSGDHWNRITGCNEPVPWS